MSARVTKFSWTEHNPYTNRNTHIFRSLTFFNRRQQREIPANLLSGQNSAHDQKLKKNMDTLHSKTLKIKEKKVPLVFSHFCSGAENLHVLSICPK